MGGNGTFAVIPVKPFAAAKQRMAPFLDRSERAQLARTMFEDVLVAACAARELSGVLAVTCDTEACLIARRAGARAIVESGQFGLVPAIRTAVRELLRIGAGGMIVIPADIPHLCPGLIDEVVKCTPSPGVTIVPARSDGGTNLLAVRPCNLMPPLFGPNSFARHRAAARAGGVEPLLLNSRIAGHDIDQPGDLIDFLALNTPARTHQFLVGLDLPRRARGGLS